MYAQCYEYGNDFLPIDSMVDYRKNGNDLTLKYQNIVVKGRS